MWTLHKQPQHCGAQLHARPAGPRQPGEPPAEAVEDRAAQEHDRADLDVSGREPQPGDYPASAADRGGDPSTELRTPSAPDPAWDLVVQPERRQPDAAHDWDDLPLPEGK